MSSYRKQTVHPETHALENAEWLDDFFGQHNYGVRFPSDGKTFRADEFDWQENPATMAFEGIHRGGAMTVEHTHKGSRFDNPMREYEEKDGKTSITTKHEDGRQDVEIKVNRLNIENRTPEDTIAEEKIVDAMSKKIVRVVVIHKPTNESANFDCPLPLVRKRAEEVVKAYNNRLAEKLGVAGAEAPKSEFVIVEFDAGQIRVSSL